MGIVHTQHPCTCTQAQPFTSQCVICSHSGSCVQGVVAVLALSVCVCMRPPSCTSTGSVCCILAILMSVALGLEGSWLTYFAEKAMLLNCSSCSLASSQHTAAISTRQRTGALMTPLPFVLADCTCAMTIMQKTSKTVKTLERNLSREICESKKPCKYYNSVKPVINVP